MFIMLTVIAVVAMTNIIGSVLIIPTRKEFRKLRKKDYYEPSLTLMNLERALLLLSALGGWFGIFLSAYLLNYKSRMKSARFYLRLSGTKYSAIVITSLIIVMTAMALTFPTISSQIVEAIIK